MSEPKPLRIFMVSDEWRPYIGGAGRCMELFADELVNRGHTVEVATAWHNDAPAFEDGRVPVHRIRDLTSRAQWVSENPDRHTPPPFPDPEAVWRLRRLVKRFQPDLIPAGAPGIDDASSRPRKPYERSDRDDPPRHPAVPGGPRRQPATPATSADGPRTTSRGRARLRRAAGRRGRSDP